MNEPLTPLRIPLYLHGVTSWLPVSKPTLEDWNQEQYQAIELTAEQLDWDPTDRRYQEAEEALADQDAYIYGTDHKDNRLMISSLTSLTMPSADITGDSNFGTILESKVCVSAVDASMLTKSSKLEASMTIRPRNVLWWTHLHLQSAGTFRLTAQRPLSA